MSTSAARSADRTSGRLRALGALRAPRIGAFLLLAVVATGVIAGCATTYDTASWEQLRDARQRADTAVTRVKTVNASVTPTQISLIRSTKRSAFVVTVHNGSGNSISDLPISVGYVIAGGKRVFANASSGIGYFGAHVPVIQASKSLTWVYTTSHAVPHGAKLFASVGQHAAPATHLDNGTVTISPSGEKITGASARAKVTNNSGVTQYLLPVYAVVQRNGRYVAAGSATVAQLNSGKTRSLKVRLVGDASSGDVQISAVPSTL